MTLHDVLHEVLRHIELRPLTDVTIERGDLTESPVGGSEVHQLSFGLRDHLVLCAHRSFGTGGWTSWQAMEKGHLGGSIGFDLLDVLAEDWRILSP